MHHLLGEKVRDTVTGFTGTCTAACEYLHEATQIRVESEDSAETRWFVSLRIEAIETKD